MPWISKILPETHVLKFIAKLMDFSFIQSITQNSYHLRLGRPSIDPEVFFRMTLIGYLFGIKSDRRLCDEIQCNLLYRWFCCIRLETKVPHHSSLSRIRTRLGADVFQQIFNVIVNKCIEIGIVKGKRILVDSSLIHANAALDSLSPRNASTLSLTAGKQRYSTTEKISNHAYQSKTDPDATLAIKKGKAKALRYKVHTAIDSHSRVILDSKVTTGSCHDSVLFLSQLEDIKNRFPLEIKEVVADRAYGSGNILTQLEKQEIRTFIPLFNTLTGGVYDLEEKGFIFNPEKNAYICPENKLMLPYKSALDYQQRIPYRASRLDCASCTKADGCSTGFAEGKHGKHIVRNAYQTTYEKVLKKINSQDFIEKKYERLWKIEGIFAEAKNNHLLDRTKYRGLEKTQLHATIIAIVQNIKRIVKHFIS